MEDKSRIKNIAIIVDSIAYGGAEKVAALLSLFFKDKGYNVYLVLDRRYGKKEYAYAGKIIRARRLETGNPWINMYHRATDLQRIKHEYHIDCAISFMEEYNFANVLSKENEKVIVSVRTYLSARMDEWWNEKVRYKLLIPLLYNRADKVVAVTDVGKEDLMHNFKVNRRKICVIPNPIDERIYFEKQKSVCLMGKAIVAVGRHERVKAQWQIIRAMKAVIVKVPDAHLYFVGEGSTTGYLKRLARALNIENNIHFVGYRVNVSEYLKQARVFVLSSEAEGFPNVILDALACGVPIVSTDCLSGPRDILAPGTEYEKNLNGIEYARYGILVPRPESYQEDISAVLKNSELKMAEALIAILRNDNFYIYYSEQSRKRANVYKRDYVCELWENMMRKLSGS